MNLAPALAALQVPRGLQAAGGVHGSLLQTLVQEREKANASTAIGYSFKNQQHLLKCSKFLTIFG